MIDARELRIGNYVMWTGFENDIIKIDSITEKGTWISTENGTHGVEWKDLQPIPLTEEILMKCGFEHNYKSDYTITLSHTTDDRFNFKIYKEGGFSLWYLGVPIPVGNLHQLQNLFYALSGEELEVQI